MQTPLLRNKSFYILAAQRSHFHLNQQNTNIAVMKWKEHYEYK